MRRRLVDRVFCVWKLKLVGTVVCSAGFVGLYFLVQRLHWFESRPMVLTRLDAWVAFDPRWTLVYESLWLLLPVAPWLAGGAGDVRRYLRGFALICAVAFPLFLFCPIDAPRPDFSIDHPPDHTLYRMLIAVDGLRNSFPSLHAGLGVYSVLVVRRMLREMGVCTRLRGGLVAGLWLWLTAILFATLATKQHGVVDLPAGLLLGGFAYAYGCRLPNRACISP